MKLDKIGDNSAIPNSEVDETPDVPQNPDGDKKAGEIHVTGSTRRSFLIRLTALVASAALPGTARADDKTDTDPAYEARKEILKERFGGKEYQQEQLSEDEILMMDITINTIFRHYLQPSFFTSAVPGGQEEEDEVRKAIQEAILYFDKLHYQKSANSDTVIKARRLPSGNHSLSHFRQIVIGKDGVIKKINGHTISGIGDWEKEWKEVQERIEDINTRIDDDHSSVTAEDLKWHEYYTFKLPAQFRKLLEWKQRAFSLNRFENDILRRLQAHPTSRKKAVQMRSRNRRLGFEVTRVSRNRPAASPFGMAELSYPPDHPNMAFQTFAGLSFDGSVMQNLTPGLTRKATWIKVSPSFAELYCGKIGKALRECMPVSTKRIEDQCAQNIHLESGSGQSDRREDIDRCNQTADPAQCLRGQGEQQSRTFHRGRLSQCFRDKFQKWLSQARNR